MTTKEQLIGILKASPHLPIQAFTGLIMLIAIPILGVKLVEYATTDWIQTSASISLYIDIQERTKDKKTEFFYQIEYQYPVKGESLTFRTDHGFSTKISAEKDLSWIKKYPEDITIWYDQNNPINYEVDNAEDAWLIYLFIMIIPISVLAYCRWILLKYYELEIKNNST